MTNTTDLASEKRQLTEEQKTVVLELHDRALHMTALAVNALRADTTNDYANAMAVVMPLLGYAFETVAKAALALNQFQLTGSMPSPADLIKLATYPKHARPFLSQDLPSNFCVRPGFRGHAVGVIIENVTGRLQVPGAAALSLNPPVDILWLGVDSPIGSQRRFSMMRGSGSPKQLLREAGLPRSRRRSHHRKRDRPAPGPRSRSA